MPLLDDLEALRTQAAAAFEAAQDPKALEAARVEYLGQRGKLKSLLGRMGEVPKEQKPVVGKRANEIGKEVQSLFDAAKARVEASPSAPASSFEMLRQERLTKLKLYEAEAPKLGLPSAWGCRFPDAAGGKQLSSTEQLRQMFATMDKAKDTDPATTVQSEVWLAARVMLRRDQSKKLIFLTAQDQAGTIQVALCNTLLNEQVLALLRDTLDLWDIVGISGKLAFTQKGEPTVWATSARILSKCIAPPPDKFHGLHDKELRYRQRYLDLIAEPQTRKTFVMRAKAVAGLRRFLDDRGFLELETPVLQTIPGGAAARPFETELHALHMKMYLRIATEIPLKKLLVGGLEKVYELGRIFRNEGIDARHNPEFTTVEIYQAYGDLRDMMELTETAVSKLAQELTGSTTVTWRGKPIKLGTPWPRLDYTELMQKHAGVAPDDIAGLDRKLLDKKIDPAGLSHVEKIDGVFGAYCEESLQDACFVINQPVEMSPLCRAHPQNAKLADRFEAFAAGMEIANAYTELNDPSEQRFRFTVQVSAHLFENKGLLTKHLKAPTVSPEAVQALEDMVGLSHLRFLQVIEQLRTLRKDWERIGKDITEVDLALANAAPSVAIAEQTHHRGALAENTNAFIKALPDSDPRKAELARAKERISDPSLLVDEDFLNALEHAMPPAGGLGIGVDRVMMLLANADSIRDVIPFPLMRPE
jgi:lysyl-tRNA synthetase class 2